MELRTIKGTITNYGYLVKKCDYSEEQLEYFRNDLTVKPKLNNKYDPKEKEPFPVFQEGKTKLLLPKYYGIETLGIPNEIATNIDDKCINLTFNGSLRDYQVPIIDACLKHYFDKDGNLLQFGGGVIIVPPGKGKTGMGLYLGSLINKPFLIIVHKTFLLNQWKERINQFLPNAKIGIIQQDKIDIEGKDIVIGMLQSICQKDYDEDVFEKFQFVIFDEVHHLGAKKFSNALLKIQAPYTLGLSATPKRNDKLEKVFYWHLGPPMWEQYAESDKTVTIKMYNYKLSGPNKLFKPVFNFRTKQVNMAKMVTNLTEIDERNQHIINLITSEIFPQIPMLENKIKINKITKKNVFNHKLYDDLIEISVEPVIRFRKCLILSNRIEHLKRIEQLLISLDKRWQNLIGYYIGGMKEKKLKESETKPLILGTFEMASEGLDIPDIDTIILGTPKSNITQSLGRMLRLQSHMRHFNPIAYDIVDDLSMFVAQGKKRYSEYKSKEYNIEWYQVTDTEIMDIENPFFMVYNVDNDQFIDSDNDTE